MSPPLPNVPWGKNQPGGTHHSGAQDTNRDSRRTVYLLPVPCLTSPPLGLNPSDWLPNCLRFGSFFLRYSPHLHIWPERLRLSKGFISSKVLENDLAPASNGERESCRG